MNCRCFFLKDKDIASELRSKGETHVFSTCFEEAFDHLMKVFFLNQVSFGCLVLRIFWNKYSDGLLHQFVIAYIFGIEIMQIDDPRSGSRKQ